MKGSRTAAILLIVPTLLAACGTPPDTTAPASTPAATTADGPPTFEVDPTWPRELPNNWILGAITGVFVDAQDHVWVTHLPED